MAVSLFRAANPVFNVGRGLGAIGGAISALTGGRAGEGLRSLGGQLTGGYRSFSLVPTARAAEPQTYGMSTQPMQSPWIPPSVLGTRTTGGGGTTQPAGQPTGNVPQESAGGAPDTSYLDALIQPALDTLAGLEAETRSLLGGGEQEAEAFRGASEAKATEAKRTGLATIGQRQQASEARAGEAEAGQRRGFAEIAQQFLGRFGRTGFGQGVIGSLGENTLQTIGRIRTGLQETINELNIRRDQLEDVFNSAVQEAGFQAENLKQQARAQLQQALAEIGSRRAELQTRRAELVNRALELYRQNVVDINARNVKFQQDLALAREQANLRIKEAQARAQQNLATLPSFELSPGQTKFFPQSQLGGQAGIEQLQGTQLPGGVQFGTAGGFGIFSAPEKKNLVTIGGVTYDENGNIVP